MEKKWAGLDAVTTVTLSGGPK